MAVGKSLLASCSRSATLSSKAVQRQSSSKQAQTAVFHSMSAKSPVIKIANAMTNKICRRDFSVLDSAARSMTNELETVLVGTQNESVAAIAPPRQCPFHKLLQKFDTPARDDSVMTMTTVNGLKPFSTVPTPKPLDGTLLSGELGLWYERIFKSDLKNKFHEYVDMRCKQIGPIYREKLGGLDAVFLSDAADVAKVFAAEGKHPRHVVPDPWKLQMETTKQPRGLFFLDGERWQKKRRIMNHALMRKDAVPSHIPNFVRVVDDLIARWEKKRDVKTKIVKQLDDDLFHFSIESTGTILFNERLGCLDATPPKNIQEFIHSLRELFNMTLSLCMVPLPVLKKVRNWLPQWRKFSALWDKQLQIAQQMTAAQVEKAIDRFEANKLSPSQQVTNGQLVHRLLASDNLTMDQVVRLVTDFFSAGADTVSNTLQWTLYLLSKHPEAQARVAAEMNQFSAARNAASSEQQQTSLDVNDFQEMKFTKAVLRESMRLFPIAPFHTRILDHDINLRGYHIPRNTTLIMCAYTMGRNETYFKDADTFNPERWLRSSTSTTANGNNNAESSDDDKRHAGFAALPYGYGPRGCVGRRLADPMMMLAIGKFCQKYKFSYANERDLAIHNRMVLVPDQSLSVMMEERQATN